MKEEIIHNLPFIFIIIPLIATLTLYQISYFIFKHRWKAIHLSVQWTAIFYIIAVTILLEKLIEQNIIGYILIGLIVTLAVILIIQWKNNTEVILLNGLRVLWRICFLLFAVTYMVLISYELFQLIYINYAN